VIFLEELIKKIRKFYKLNGYDFINPITVSDVVECTKLSEDEIEKVVKCLR